MEVYIFIVYYLAVECSFVSQLLFGQFLVESYVDIVEM